MESFDMTGLRKFVAPECVLGPGARFLAANYAANAGARKVLVVTDPGVIAAGWVDDVLTSLRDDGLPYSVYDAVTSNPLSQEVMTGAAVYQNEDCNCIIAVGGGSPIDCAKGIGIVSSNRRDILDFVGVDQVRIPIPPLICVPTTGGSSADMSQFAIIGDTRQRVKTAIISKAIVPDISLIDPVTLTSMPAALTVETGLDTLTHAFEAYVSIGQSAVTDVLALEAIRLVTRHLLDTVRDPKNVDLRGKIAVACFHAGLAFSNAGLGLAHAMAHSLGGFVSIPHGDINARLLRHVVAYNFPAAVSRYTDIAQAMGVDITGMMPEDVPAALDGALEHLQSDAEVTGGLGSLGLRAGDIPELAHGAMGDPDVVTNPREPSLEDIKAIYERAL